jgi:hypothetical protein
MSMNRKRTAVRTPPTFRRVWATIGINVLLLLVLLYVIKPIVGSMGTEPGDTSPFVVIDGVARVPGTGFQAQVAKMPSAFRVIFLGNFSSRSDSRTDPANELLARVAPLVPGKTLDFIVFPAGKEPMTDLARICERLPLFTPDLVVFDNSATSAATGDQAAKSQAAARQVLSHKAIRTAFVNLDERDGDPAVASFLAGLIASPGVGDSK